MFKKLGFAAVALFGLMVLANPPQASAAVRFGVVVGGPVYTAPAPVYSYPDPYADPYYSYPPSYGYGYVAPAPVYSYPYSYGYGYYGGYGYRDHYRDYDRRYDRGYRGGYGFRGREGGRRR